MNRKIISTILALALIFSLLPTNIISNAADSTANDAANEEVTEDESYTRIEISNLDDFVNFTSQCYIDSWSKDKYVVLTSNIDLAGAEYETVPVFNGTFDGNGHTISNFDYTGNGYVVGLFRYIESDGIIKDLTLTGNIESENEQECIGSIAGINYGTIRNCTFTGTVSGSDTVGGIVGTNETTGTISNCVSNGRVTGYYSTGGIAGINHGAITSCTNRAGVNDNEAWVEADDEMGGVEMVKSLVSEDDSEVYSGVDSGGIAGYSDGIISHCTNTGVVGYEHTGYNIGGIVGRQSGIVSLCTNSGMVYGRKDVGGIAGQMEPDIEVNEAESLRDALDKLHDLINKTIDDMSDTKNVVKQDVDNMLKYADAAIDTGDELATQLSDFSDDNIDEINALSERMEHVMDMLPDVLDDATNACDYTLTLNDNLNKLVQDINFIDDISSDDKDKLNSSRDAISDEAKNLENESEDMQESVTRLREILDKYAEKDDTTGADSSTGPNDTNALTTTADTTVSDAITNRWDKISEADQTAIEDELVNILEIIADMSSSSATILSNVSNVISVLEPYVTNAANAASTDANNASEATRNTINALKSANENTKSIVNYMNSQEDIRFSKLEDDFDVTKENFHDNLKGISDSLKTLNENASSYTDVVNNDLKAVNNQLNVVFNLLADRITEIDDLDMDDLYEDVTDEDIDEITTGRVEYSKNTGIIKGDINVGGIAGSMSIDDEDPEDSAAGSVEYKLGRSYIAKCLITGCTNEGYIIAKKDGAGGICGYANHGIIVESEGYGSVESSEGDYVGGICGQSLTIIKRCYALCSVSGGQNVGGIAGYADTLTDCYSMSDVIAESGRAGAIAGQIASYDEVGSEDDSEAKVRNNYYVNDDMYGIDNISYVGVAEPITYQELLEIENIPTQFWHLKVIYKIEDTYLGSEEVAYGAKLDNLTYPTIPVKEGYYGEWPDVTGKVMKGTTVVEAEYMDSVTVVESTGIEDGKSIALVEDSFTQDTVLVAKKVDMNSTSLIAPSQAEDREFVIYELSVEDEMVDESANVTVRLLNPYDDARVYIYGNDGWNELDSKVRGSYLQATMTGSHQYFCIVEEKANYVLIIACVASALAVAAIIIILAKMVISRRRKNRKK